jgi:hypothetical protein
MMITFSSKLWEKSTVVFALVKKLNFGDDANLNKSLPNTEPLLFPLS